MLAVHLLEESEPGTVSIWIPVVILGWFSVMTIVGQWVSRRNASEVSTSQDAHTPNPENPPSEFDNH